MEFSKRWAIFQKADFSGDGRGEKFSHVVLLPSHADFERAVGLEARETAGFPHGLQRREEIDAVGAALEQHFGDAGGAFNFKWRMCAEPI